MGDLTYLLTRLKAIVAVPWYESSTALRGRR
jgi:hypothetical protein